VVANDNLLEGEELEVNDLVDVVAAVEENWHNLWMCPQLLQLLPQPLQLTLLLVVGRPPIVPPLLHQWPAVRPKLNTTSSFW